MTLHWMVYALALSALLAPGAFFLERALRSLRRPARWVWMGALLGSTLAPPTVFLARQAGGEIAPAAAAHPALEAFLYQGASTVLPAASSPLLFPSAPLASLDPLLGGLWAATSLALLLLLLLTHGRLSRTARRWREMEVGGARVLLSDGVGPAVAGLLSPRIVLPPWALEVEPRGLEMILHHEREHARTRDPALLAAGTFLVALAPWNPILWRMLARLRLAMEVDCDQRVLARGVPRQAYGRLLLEVGGGRWRAGALTPALLEGSTSTLERRLRMLRDDVRPLRAPAVATTTLACAFFLGLACETPTPPVPPLDTSPELALEPRTPAPPLDLSDAGDRWRIGAPPGTIQGERVVMGGGEGEVRIRYRGPAEDAPGAAGAPPLLLVDGVVVGDPSEVSRITPEQIERIEVVKGAAAGALYGPRGSNGVILVTLKK